MVLSGHFCCPKYFCFQSRAKAVITGQVGGWWDYMKLMNAETFPEPKCEAMAEATEAAQLQLCPDL